MNSRIACNEARKKSLAIIKIFRYLDKIKGCKKGPFGMEGNEYFQVEGGELFRSFLPQEGKDSH